LRTLETKLTTAIFGISILALALFHHTLDFNDKKPGPEVVITIEDGATGTKIASQLEESGVIKSKKFFVDYFVANKSAQGIAPGVHRIQSHISVRTAVSQFLDQMRITNSLKVLEGSTVSDVLALLRKNDHIKSEAIQFKSLNIPLSNISRSLEGQLAPAIYSFEPGTGLNTAISQMLERFDQNQKRIPLKSFGKYSKYDVLTIASMVQVEGDAEDFGKVAQVIYNRLKAGMPLQLNSTVQYAANLRGRIALSTEATKINSPYNTYRRVGLPPTPISNPSELAIKASLNPTQGDWIYFITVKPGDTRFTKNYDEFNAWTTLYNQNLANGLFK